MKTKFKLSTWVLILLVIACTSQSKSLEKTHNMQSDVSKAIGVIASEYTSYFHDNGYSKVYLDSVAQYKNSTHNLNIHEICQFCIFNKEDTVVISKEMINAINKRVKNINTVLSDVSNNKRRPCFVFSPLIKTKSSKLFVMEYSYKDIDHSNHALVLLLKEGDKFEFLDYLHFEEYYW